MDNQQLLGGTSTDEKDWVKPGKILRLTICLPHDSKPKEKYFVIVGFEKTPLLLKINSKNGFALGNPHLREYQFKIKKSIYPFLQYDSYLDCGTIWYVLTKEEILSQIRTDITRIVGEMSKDHCNEIIRLTNLSKSISNIHKRAIVAGLKN